MKKNDFNIPEGRTKEFVENAEIIRDNDGDCDKSIECDDCPFDHKYYKYTKNCGMVGAADGGVDKAKKFIKLFGGKK